MEVIIAIINFFIDAMTNYFLKKIGFIGIGFIAGIFVVWVPGIFGYRRDKGDCRKIKIESFEDGIYIFDNNSSERSESSGDFCGGFDSGSIDF